MGAHSPRLPGIPRLLPMRWERSWSGKITSSLNRVYGPQNVVESEWGFGDIIAGVLGMAWSVVTFFVIPVIIYEGLPPLRAIRRSWKILGYYL